MSLSEKLRHDDQVSKRALFMRNLVLFGIGLALFLFVLFYYWLPMWRGPQP